MTNLHRLTRNDYNFNRYVKWIGHTFPDIHDHVPQYEHGRKLYRTYVNNLVRFCDMKSYDPSEFSSWSDDLRHICRYMKDNKIQYELWKL